MNLEPLRELERKWRERSGGFADDDRSTEAWCAATELGNADELAAALAQLDDGWRPTVGLEACEVVHLHYEERLREYVDGYEMLGENSEGCDAYYTPTDSERALIEDAIRGWDAENEPRPLPSPPAQEDAR